MDVFKGFHEIRCSDRARQLLRIICHLGVFEYLRMPFGIKNSPSHLQRMMDMIFRNELREGWLIIYIDDIVIYSITWEDHIKRIEVVLKKCIEINMTISIKKCNFSFL